MSGVIDVPSGSREIKVADAALLVLECFLQKSGVPDDIMGVWIW